MTSNDCNQCVLAIVDSEVFSNSNIGGVSGAFGVQYVTRRDVEFISVAPGLINLNGVGYNGACAMRIYREIIGQNGQWIINPKHTINPWYVQIAVNPVMIPMSGKEMNLFIEFLPVIQPIPTPGSIELSVAGYGWLKGGRPGCG